ncbi:heterokaryon incompatibility protein-domain-containing protein [Ampelomyces quisqualis]|uniref:Heterokaryon incompatibility protein-domain-containing protein n=1 Tax=Ampelomyces quisqualis TaxID=50730 RepID=A0A6A5QVU6_AMPQU|nr:heterokaryon incompatibility protein-domain-containing protein [Ampelomyces quisqualis]
MDDEDNPVVTLHPSCDFAVNKYYECPLESESQHTVAAARASAQNGCPSCILRYTIIQHFAPEAPDTADISCAHDYIFLPFHVATQSFVLAWQDNNDKLDVAPLQFYNFYNTHIGGLEIIEHNIPFNTRSESTLATVKKWLIECSSKHTCATLARNPHLPQRLLDLRNNIRLIEAPFTSISSSIPRYACLSHRWGTDGHPLRLTAARLREYQSNIAPQNLGRTYRDAIDFCRRLGVDYLWIDSLCIIQEGDGGKDWEEQSGRMAGVYGNAYVTLSAAVAEGTRGGCYTDVNDAGVEFDYGPVEEKKRETVLRATWKSGEVIDVCARKKLRHKMDDLPLFKRAWIYQERVISPRVVHFVGDEVWWECNGMLRCECGSEGLENGFDRIPLTSANEPDNYDGECAEYVITGPHSHHGVSLGLWYQIVSDYTSLSMTKQTDAFPALSGIAKRFAAKMEDEYIAGLWKSTLIPNLLWFFLPPEHSGHANEVPKWRAPSWSWVSRAWSSEIRWFAVTNELAKVKEVACTPKGVDPTGELSSAWVMLETKAIPASLVRLPGYENSRYKFTCDSGLDIMETRDKNSFGLWKEGTGYLDLDDSCFPTDIASLEIVVAQMASYIRGQHVYLYEQHDSIDIVQEVRIYILLARREEGEEGWVRVGLVSITLYAPNESLFGDGAWTLTRGEKKEKVKRMTRQDIESSLEDRAHQNRAIFESFDDSEARELVVW